MIWIPDPTEIDWVGFVCAQPNLYIPTPLSIFAHSKILTWFKRNQARSFLVRKIGLKKKKKEKNNVWPII